jgi:hypothetical protein
MYISYIAFGCKIFSAYVEWKWIVVNS